MARPEMEHCKKYLSEPVIMLLLAGLTLIMATLLKIAGHDTVRQTLKPASVIPKPKVIPTDTVSSQDSLHRATTVENEEGSTLTGLEPFFASLLALGDKPDTIHIAYFGDSMIEGDLITHPLRMLFQQRFGGRGVGFVPVTVPQPGFRTTIIHSFNDRWEEFSFVHPAKSKEYPAGFSGYVFGTRQGASVTYKTTGIYGPFRHSSIFYGGLHPIMLEVTTDTTVRHLTLETDGTMSSRYVPADSAYSSLTLKVLSETPGVLYGVCLENGPGVYIDNYSFRGNSGLPLRQIPSVVFPEFNSLIGNRLIILNFGLNVYTPGVTDYHWYEQAMNGVVAHVKAASPGIPLLMISMPDRAALIDGDYYTPDGLPGFISMQKRIADKQQVAFFNLFEAMGGINSMKSWAESPQVLAGSDYTHFTAAGGKKIAGMIYHYLMEGYLKMLASQKNTSPIPVAP